jgi:integrase/recombinase XerD
MTPHERTRIGVKIEQFVEAMKSRGWSGRTIAEYRRNLGHLMDWVARQTDTHALAEIGPEALGAYAVALLGETTPAGKPLSASTRMQKLAAVKAFFAWLTREAMLLANPALAVELPKKRRPLPQALLTPKETIRLLEATSATTPLGLRDRAILEMLYSTGIRNSELRALDLSDVDPNAQTVLVRNGKGGKDRLVPLGPLAAAAVAEYIARGRPALACSEKEKHLFLTIRHGALSRLALSRLVEHAATRAGIDKPVRPHRLRHACATHMLAGGADIRHIQMLLGHASLESTQIYTRVEISDLKAVHRRFHPRERGKR